VNWDNNGVKNVKYKTAKAILLLLLSIILTAVIVGCGQTTSSTTPSSLPTKTPPPITPVELNVSAAGSMTDTLAAVNDLYMEKNKNTKITANFASSGTLQKQIEQGAPVDVFISAGAKQMQALQDGGLLLNETRADLLNNKVVLVVPANSNLNLTDFNGLVNDYVKKIAIGDPESVPAGTYGKQALDLLGIYEQVKSKLILCSDVRQVLSYVEAGNVDAGIVFSTDAAITDKVKIAAYAPAEVNSKIVYPVAVIKASQKVDAAKAYIAFLFSTDARTIFEKFGFVMVNK
jgi:molybdate transport system substrate-binding protein